MKSETDLTRWLAVVTRNLPPEAGERLRQEITEHYGFAFEHYRRRGASIEEAHHAAMAELGHAHNAARATSNVYGTHRRYLRGALVCLSMPIAIGIVWLASDLGTIAGGTIYNGTLFVAMFYALHLFQTLLASRYSFEQLDGQIKAVKAAVIYNGAVSLSLIVSIVLYGTRGYSPDYLRAVLALVIAGELISCLALIVFGMKLLSIPHRPASIGALASAMIATGMLFFSSAALSILEGSRVVNPIAPIIDVGLASVFLIWSVVFLQAQRDRFSSRVI
jgi:hypothetical protein